MLLSRCCRFFYFVCHISLCIVDLSVIGFVSYILTILIRYSLFLPFILYWPIIIIILLNIIQLFGFWQGFSGILTENTTTILIFCASLIINSIVDLIIGAWTLSIRNDIYKKISEIMENLYENYTKLQNKKEDWNNMPFQLKCCGIDGPQSFFKIGADFVPISCCNSSTNSRFCENGQFYKSGCLDSLSIFVQEQQYQFILLILVFVIIQILGITIFCNLNAILNKANILEFSAPKEENIPLRKRSSNT